ncbi:MAG: hypothetical protein QM680_07245 [Luteolibacter sp.]
MNNPLTILQTLDRKLGRKVNLVVYGRAAIALGFADPPADSFITEDVDSILSDRLVGGVSNDMEFWDALKDTNQELAALGLYMTHLFEEQQVILTSDWLDNRVPIATGLTNIHLSRPSTIHLVLTKMMRGNDRQDIVDIKFLLGSERITPAMLKAAFDRAIVPDFPEIEDSFNRLKPDALAYCEKIRGRFVPPQSPGDMPPL